MFDVDSFVIRGHEKVLEHYRRLRETSTSASERQDFERRMNEVSNTLQKYLEERLHDARRAA